MFPEFEEKDSTHEPVLLEEVLYWLKPDQGGTFLDCTLGLGGHAEAILAASPDTKVIGLDRDREALELAQRRLEIFDNRFEAAQANFEDINKILDDRNLTVVRGVLADLGVSSL